MKESNKRKSALPHFIPAIEANDDKLYDCYSTRFKDLNIGDKFIFNVIPSGKAKESSGKVFVKTHKELCRNVGRFQGFHILPAKNQFVIPVVEAIKVPLYTAVRDLEVIKFYEVAKIHEKDKIVELLDKQSGAKVLVQYKHLVIIS